jgi:DMSO/TMAO reductase YedYZ heme-binding membrane subunit/ferredoxin
VPGSLLLTSAAAARSAVTSDSADHALHNTAAFAGFAAYALMVGTIVWGVFTATGVVRRSIRRETLHGGHMTMAVAALAFIVVHVVANVLRPAAHLTIWHASVPFLHPSKAIAVGVVSAELAFVTSVTVLFRRRLGYRTWHRLHWLGYPTYGLAIAHTIMAGSDVRRPLVAIFLGVTMAIVFVLTGLRLLPSTATLRNRLVRIRSMKNPPPSDRVTIVLDQPSELHEIGLRIRVDVSGDHCERYAICEQEAPAVFRMRADGRLEYKASPGPEQRDAVRQAARLCPMQAILVEEQRR